MRQYHRFVVSDLIANNKCVDLTEDILRALPGDARLWLTEYLATNDLPEDFFLAPQFFIEQIEKELGKSIDIDVVSCVDHDNDDYVATLVITLKLPGSELIPADRRTNIYHLLWNGEN